MFKYEDDPIWDGIKDKILGHESQSFNFWNIEIGHPLPSNQHWWRIENQDGNTMGYCWISVEDDTSELSVSIAEDYRKQGLSKKAIKHLEEEIISRSFPREVMGIVKTNNPFKDIMIKQLESLGYEANFNYRDITTLDINFIKYLG